MTNRRLRRLAALLAACCLACGDADQELETEEPAEPVLTRASIVTILKENQVPWSPHDDPKRSGPGPPPAGWGDVYRRVAPSVPVVATETNHGSGLFVDDDGTILTNRHVIEKGLAFDRDTGVSYATVYVGSFDDSGSMVRNPEPLRADFLDADERVDLALLRLRRPSAVSGVRRAQLATSVPDPGTPSGLLGHPAEGFLWTMRACTVSNSGVFPRDLVGELARMLVRGPDAVSTEVAPLATHEIVLTDCPAGPGDSGGPLLNTDGEVIGLTEQISDSARGRFSYHVKLDELSTFLERAGREPRPFVPDPWITGALPSMMGPSTVFAVSDGVREWLLDLDNDSPATLVRAALSNDAEARRQLIRDRRFEAEMAIHEGPSGSRVHYDTDNDGTFDLLVLFRTPRNRLSTRTAADVAFRLGEDARWTIDPETNIRWNDPQPLVDPPLRKKYDKLERVGYKG